MTEEIARVSELTSEAKLNDEDFIAMYAKVGNALSESFGKEAVDTGMGGGWADYWVRHEGVEYKLVMKPHKSLSKPQ